MGGRCWQKAGPGKGAVTAMTSRRDPLIDGTTGRLGWSDRAQGLYRAALGVAAVLIGLAALIWHPSVLAAVGGAVLTAGGVSLILVHVQARREGRR